MLKKTPSDRDKNKPKTPKDEFFTAKRSQSTEFQPTSVGLPLQRQAEVESLPTAPVKSSHSAKRLLADRPLPKSSSLPLQAKLEIGAASDRYEQEADRMARQVVQRLHAPESKRRSQQPSLQQGKGNNVQMHPQLTQTIQRQDHLGGREAPPELESGINRARGGGQPLDATLQRQMGTEMGMDFSGVRVHTNSAANRLNESIQAKAFTTGQDVFFKQGAYQPDSRGGQELIAHELTHVAQQSHNSVQKKGSEKIQRFIINDMGEKADGVKIKFNISNNRVNKGNAITILKQYTDENKAKELVEKYSGEETSINLKKLITKAQISSLSVQVPPESQERDEVEILDESEETKPTPENPNVPYDRLPKGTIEDIKKFLAKAEASKKDSSQIDYEPEVVNFIDMEKLKLLTSVSDRIPVLYRGFMYMPEAARKIVLEGETVSGKARNEKKDLETTQQDFKADYMVDENDDENAKKEKFMKLRKAVDSHKGSGHGTSNFVGTSANPEYVLNWINPSLSTESDVFSIAVAIVPKETDLLFKSVDLITKAGCGTSTENGKVVDWEQEYLFAGGYDKDRVVGYVTIKYKQLPPRPKGDVFAEDKSVNQLYELKKKQAIELDKNPEGNKEGDETDKYNFALFHLANKRELEIQRDKEQKVADTAKGVTQMIAASNVEKLEKKIKLIENTHLQNIPENLTKDLKVLEDLRAREIERAKSPPQKFVPNMILDSKIKELKNQLGVPQEFTTITKGEKEALLKQKSESKVDKSQYKTRNDEIYIVKKRFGEDSAHEAILMEHKTSKALVVWKPEDRAHMRAAETGGSGLASEMLGEDLVAKAVEIELFNPGTETWQKGTIQPFKESQKSEKDVHPTLTNLTLNSDQVAQMLAHMIADWVIGNYDNHPGQFLLGKDGSIIGLDKGQALKYTYEGAIGSPQDRINDLALEKLDDSAFAKDTFFPNVNDEVQTTLNKKPITDQHIAITRNLISKIKNGELTVNWKEPHLVQALDFATNLNANKVKEHFETLGNLKFEGKQDELYDKIAKRANQIKAQLKQTLGSEKVPVTFPDFEN